MTGQQLKNSILQMAVQGKLVPQDPNDEPASVLLERIRAEKERLIKEGKIKKEKNPSIIFRGTDNLPYEKVGKNEPVCIADEVPFEIPESWEWVRLGKIVYNRGQMKPIDDFCYIDIGSIDNKNQKLNDEEFIITADKAPSRARKIVAIGDILYSTVRPYLHNMCIVNRSFSHQPIASTGFAALTCHTGFYNKFLFYYLISPDFDAYANSTDNAKGVAYPAINDTKLYRALIPVPPEEEQKRIIKRLNKVLPYVDTYSTTYSETESLNNTFPDRLKKSILQEAVQGKLIPQEPSDEPASILLERIHAEKQRLIKEGKIKKDKHESVIFRRDNSHYEKHGSEEVCIDEELPFEIPDNWEWVKLSDLVQFIGGYAYKSETFIEKSEFQVLRLGNVKNDEIRYSAKPVFISKELAEKTADFRCKPNDILLTMTGTRLKRDYFYTVAVSNKDINCFINQRVGCLREYYPNIYKWLIWVLKSEEILSQVFKYETGTANQGNLGAENIMKTFIPLPPLNEQNRICNMIECLLKKTSAL